MNEEIKKRVMKIKTHLPKNAVHLTFTEENMKAIAKAARECNMTTTAYIRSLCMLSLEE